MSERPIPMLDDLALDYVLAARQRTTQRTLSLPVAGLAGDVQQGNGRASYEIELQGVIVGEDARDKLRALQEKVATGEEVTFASDITSALELDKVVVFEAEFREQGGRPGHFAYQLHLRESPPVPPPAELSSFGGLGGFDLGFDTDIMGDITDAASELQGAIDQVTSALDTLQALAGLGDLGLNNPLTPVQEQGESVASAGSGVGDAAPRLGALLGGGA